MESGIWMGRRPGAWHGRRRCSRTMSAVCGLHKRASLVRRQPAHPTLLFRVLRRHPAHHARPPVADAGMPQRAAELRHRKEGDRVIAWRTAGPKSVAGRDHLVRRSAAAAASRRAKLFGRCGLPTLRSCAWRANSTRASSGRLWSRWRVQCGRHRDVCLIASRARATAGHRRRQSDR